MKTLKIIATMFVITLSVSACGNTLHGIGQDIEKAGEKIQDATN